MSSTQEVSTVRPSTQAELERVVQRANQAKQTWIETDTQQRLRLIHECIKGMEAIADEWVAVSRTAKGVDKSDHAAKEEWSFVIIIFRILHNLKDTLEQLDQHNAPDIADTLSRHDNGRVMATIFPSTTKDRMLYAGSTGEIWFKQGVFEADILEHVASAYRTPQQGRVTLVLGAGNVSALVPSDFLQKLFVENQTVILKMNPVNDYLGRYIESAFAPLIQMGVLQVVYGGIEEGQYLIHHDLIDELHITGSDKTHDAIVFGTGAEGAKNKAQRTPIVTKRFTSELGNISPVIIIPGDWSESDLLKQGRALVARLTTNAGFNCLTPRVVINHQQWQQRQAYNDQVNQTLAQVPTRKAYYPNAERIYDQFMDTYPDANQHGERTDSVLPWTYITDIDPTDTDNIAFTVEAFCGLCTETALSANSIPEYIAKAVEFANQTLWGTLVASIIVHPESMKDPAIAQAIEQAIADLQYGSVVINGYGETAYLTGVTPWGGYPDQPIYDIQSGNGFANNTLMVEESHIEKSVVRQEFNSPTNIINPVDNSYTKLLEPMAHFEAQPSLKRGLSLTQALIKSAL